METESQTSLEAINDIRQMMQRSGKFLSLSGLSGIWAGTVALAAAAFAYLRILPVLERNYFQPGGNPARSFVDEWLYQPLLLGVATMIIAAAGACYFTIRRARRQGISLWNYASRQLAWHILLPLFAGGVMCLAFVYYGNGFYVAPACLIFYGLALVNGSKFTLGEIRYLGYLEVVLGILNLFLPQWSLWLWAAGFGFLHILYGIIMWQRYEA